jgi:hypothetical protein
MKVAREMGNLRDVDISNPLNTSNSFLFITGSSRIDYKSIKGFAVLVALNFDKNLGKCGSIAFQEPGDIVASTVSRLKNPEVITGASSNADVLLVGCARNIHCVHFAGGEFIHLVKLIDVFGNSPTPISCISNLGSRAICVSDKLNYFVSLDLASMSGSGIAITK